MPKDSLLSSKAFKQEDFGGLYREARDPREKRRALALFLLQWTDLSVKGVASMLNVSQVSIHDWLTRYRERGLAGLRNKTDSDQNKIPESFGREDFTTLYRNAKNHDDKIRYLGLLLLQRGDRSVEEVASILLTSRTAVYEWLRRYREKGIAEPSKRGVKGKGGRKRILSSQQRLLVERLANEFAQKSSRGVGGCLLHQELVKRGIRCSQASVYRWLAQARGRKAGMDRSEGS